MDDIFKKFVSYRGITECGIIKNISSIHRLVLDNELQKPLEFPKCLSYANELNRGGLLHSLKMEAGQ